MPTDDETLLFLPGASGNVEIWRPLSDRIQHPGPRRFLGWPGFGGLPPDPNVRGLRDLAELVRVSIDGPTALFAQSMGGVVAVLALLQGSIPVRRLTLAVTSGGIDVAALGATDWRREFRVRNPELPEWFETESWDLSAKLRAIRVPALLLWSDADPISPVAVGERLQELLPNAELVVVRGGSHDLVAERSDELAPHVERHLAKPVPNVRSA